MGFIIVLVFATPLALVGLALLVEEHPAYRKRRNKQFNRFRLLLGCLLVFFSLLYLLKYAFFLPDREDYSVKKSEQNYQIHFSILN